MGYSDQWNRNAISSGRTKLNIWPKVQKALQNPDKWFKVTSFQGNSTQSVYLQFHPHKWRASRQIDNIHYTVCEGSEVWSGPKNFRLTEKKKTGLFLRAKRHVQPHINPLLGYIWVPVPVSTENKHTVTHVPYRICSKITFWIKLKLLLQ